MNRRRLEFTQGSSNKFYEVTIAQKSESEWIVTTKWGRIGNIGTMQERKFTSEIFARTHASTKIGEKRHKGYVEVSMESLEKETSPDYLEESNEMKLPKVWPNLQGELLKGERAIYEKHDDQRTRQRRKAIASKWKVLVQSKASSQEIKDVQKAAWLLLRYTYLNYLVSVGSYKPATHEAARATVTQLREKLKSLPETERMVIDSSLKVFTLKSGPLSLKECEEGVNAFVNQMIYEIKEKEKVGLGGVSRKRAKLLARRLKENENKDRISK
jgi:predicted DNA-binding WGR domain protein